MAITLCHVRRPVAEKFSGNIKARAVHYHFACKDVPQVVNAQVLKSGIAAGGLEGMLEIDYFFAGIVEYIQTAFGLLYTA